MRALRMTECTHDIHHGVLDPTALARTLQIYFLARDGERLEDVDLELAVARLRLQARILLRVAGIGRMKGRVRVSES